MIESHKVVAWTPYGRQETVSVLGQYMRREHERGLVDEWWLCLNTDADQVDDLRYAYALAGAYPWIKLKERPADRPRRTPKQRNTGYFYEYMTDPGSVFLRLDDDIIYVHPDAVERLVRHRLEAAGGVASFPIMWNNSIISWYAQQAGVIPAPGTVDTLDGHPYTWPAVGGPYCMDPVGWADGRFGVAIHRLALDRIESGEAEKMFLYQDMPLPVGMQFSVSTFASLGKLYQGLEQPGVLVPYEEEHWHTVHQPQVLGVPNTIVGDALVSHYTFFPQGAVIRQTDVLDRYRALAARETA